VNEISAKAWIWIQKLARVILKGRRAVQYATEESKTFNEKFKIGGGQVLIKN